MEFKSLIARFYDSTLNVLTFWKINNIRKEVLTAIPKKRKLKILEIGCGTGSQLIEIKKTLSAECYGVDISQDMIEIAKRKAKKLNLKINFFKQDFSKTNFKKDNFDVVIASLVLHEVDLNTREESIKDIIRVLKKNGKLIILDFIRPNGHIRRIMQNIYFLLFEKYAKEFLGHKNHILHNFRKDYSKKILGVLAVERYNIKKSVYWV